jgi:3-oxoacyl-[acyl-carrier protein] reductase
VADLPLAGSVTLVTGATGGIGSAICRRFAAAGSRVVVGYGHRADAAAALAESLAGGDHAVAHADMSDSDALGQLARFVDGRYGRLDVLVNGAGTTRFVQHGDLDGLDDDLIDQMFRVNWRGPFATVRALRGLLAADPGGLVVNVSSIAGLTGMGSNVAYCASKAALHSMTLSLARALAPSIRVVAVAPGFVDTGFIAGVDDAWRDAQLQRTLLGRFAEPDDVARSVLALATQLVFVTGCVVPVDGGRLLG